MLWTLVATFPFPTCPPAPPNNVPGTDQAIQARLVENQLTTQGANLRQFDLTDSYLSSRELTYYIQPCKKENHLQICLG